MRDAGPGVPPELRDRLFERFASKGGHGTGLGLHIVRELAGRWAARPPTCRGRRRSPSACHGGCPAVTVRVLLVDDVADVRRLVRIALRFHGGFDVVGEAGAGLQAIELATRLRPDIVLLDLGLPDLAGRDVLTRVREVAPGAKVVVFTGADNDDRAYYEEHAAGYVRKSGDLDYLVELLDDIGRAAHRAESARFEADVSTRAAGPRVRTPMGCTSAAPTMSSTRPP